MQKRFTSLVGCTVAAMFLAGVTGCKNLPGSSEQQGAVIGGLGGAAAGAAIGGSQHRVLGAILGGALGAGGGYVIGANTDKIDRKDKAGAQEAMRRAEATPATPEQARAATTADLNNDGFVTIDEVIAMQKAGLGDQEMTDRLRATGQIFELTPEQERQLRDAGVSRDVVARMGSMNRDNYPTPTGRDSGVLSTPSDRYDTTTRSPGRDPYNR